jgi:Peptidase S46
MRRGRRIRRAVAILIALAAASGAARADEGFWPFTSIPQQKIRSAYGADLSGAWLAHVQRSVVKFPGGSGVFISPEGLVITNHHVALNTLTTLSSSARNLVADGFTARTRADEVRAPDLELLVLDRIDDVTARINAAVKPGQGPGEAYLARRAAIADVERESTDPLKVKGEVVALYQGALFHLYRYKRYVDVRLVFAPEFDIAFFGGDPDNFTFPRYCLDVTMFRVYEDGRPAQTSEYLQWSTAGAKPDDVVFAAGYPGSSQRLNTVAHLEYLRDTGIPFAMAWLDRRHAAMMRYANRGADERRQVQDEIFELENSAKSYTGQLAGLRDARSLAKKQESERALRQAVDRDPVLKNQYGGAWDVVEQTRGALATFLPEHVIVEGGAGFGSQLFYYARSIVRLAAERQRPDGQRLPEYSEARLPTLERKLFSQSPIYPEAEIARLADSFSFALDRLGASHPVVQTALGGQTPQARAEALVRGSKLADVTARRALVDGGSAAVAASTDPMIQLARAIDPAARAVRQRYEDTILGLERPAYSQIAQAMFAVGGTGVYPDATSSLRLSYGTVKGYVEEDGTPVLPFTRLDGLYARAQVRRERSPYVLPMRWIQRKASLDPKLPLNFVSTLDIVGGNSGSPVVNRAGELVGLVFDGNIQSLPAYFVYDAARNRTISVDARAILAALRTVYDAGGLADEIVGGRAPSTR